MFGGAPPPPSAEEIKQQEAVASQTLFAALSMCAILYVSPHAVHFVRNLV